MRYTFVVIFICSFFLQFIVQNAYAIDNNSPICDFLEEKVKINICKKKPVEDFTNVTTNVEDFEDIKPGACGENQGDCQRSVFENIKNSNTCKWNSDVMLGICKIESQGNTNLESSTDNCLTEDGEELPYSFGLMQINIIQHGDILPDYCNDLFTPYDTSASSFRKANEGPSNNDKNIGTCVEDTIKQSPSGTFFCTQRKCNLNTAKFGTKENAKNAYNQCINYLKDANNNIKTACDMFSQRYKPETETSAYMQWKISFEKTSETCSRINQSGTSDDDPDCTKTIQINDTRFQHAQAKRSCIKPTMFVLHWAADDWKNDVNEILNVLDTRTQDLYTKSEIDEAEDENAHLVYTGIDENGKEYRRYDNVLSCHLATDSQESLAMLNFYNKRVEKGACVGGWNNFAINNELTGVDFDKFFLKDPSTEITAENMNNDKLFLTSPNTNHPHYNILKNTTDNALKTACIIAKQYNIPLDKFYGHYMLDNNARSVDIKDNVNNIGKTDPGVRYLRYFKQLLKKSCPDMNLTTTISDTKKNTSIPEIAGSDTLNQIESLPIRDKNVVNAFKELMTSCTFNGKPRLNINYQSNTDIQNCVNATHFSPEAKKEIIDETTRWLGFKDGNKKLMGYQCVGWTKTVARMYAVLINGKDPGNQEGWGNAIQTLNNINTVANETNLKIDAIKDTKGSNLQMGDFVVFPASRSNGGAGHIAYVVATTPNFYFVAEANVGETGALGFRRIKPNATIAGYLRIRNIQDYIQ